MGIRERPLSPGRRSLTTSEAAALLGVSVPTVRAWSDAGSLPVHRTPGGHRRFEVDELRAWLRDADAALPAAVRAPPAAVEFPPCPALATVLAGRTDGIARHLARTRGRNPGPVPRPGATAALRESRRYVRPLARALATGRAGEATDRVQALGTRAAVDGRHVEVIVTDRRLADAVVDEATDAERAGAPIEPDGVAILRALTEHVTAALATGMALRRDAAAD
jgi:excisionase family DNA binding protein